MCVYVNVCVTKNMYMYVCVHVYVHEFHPPVKQTDKDTCPHAHVCMHSTYIDTYHSHKYTYLSYIYSHVKQTTTMQTDKIHAHMNVYVYT